MQATSNVLCTDIDFPVVIESQLTYSLGYPVIFFVCFYTDMLSSSKSNQLSMIIGLYEIN